MDILTHFIKRYGINILALMYGILAKNYIDNIRQNYPERLKNPNIETSISNILPSPTIEKKYQGVDISQIINLEYKALTTDFINVITQIIKPQNLTIFYNNINTVLINQGKKNIFNPFIVAEYDAPKNIVLLGNNHYINSLFHELLHMASTIFQDGIIYSGLSEQNIGIGLNEGYTELLAKRYFDKSSNNGYIFETQIAKLLELIIGQEKMESYYFNANLYGLIEELRKYNNFYSIDKFIANLDSLALREISPGFSDNFVTEASNSLKFIIDFLCNTYVSKLKKEYNIDLEQVKQVISSKHYDQTTDQELCRKYIDFINEIQNFVYQMPRFHIFKGNIYTITINNNQINPYTLLPIIDINIEHEYTIEQIYQLKKYRF